ncbi:MAG: hypothetical protein ACI8XO_002714 [Verrucomicrobiales bacterium]|jgi:hypothetical protein
MFTLQGNQNRNFCDGISRRNFLKIGALGLGGLSMPELLRAEAAAKIGSSQKSVIMIYLPGGPPHQDMYDIKVDAPSEIRGEFSPISTAVPGIQVCEHLPRLAKIMDKVAVIRSLVGAKDRHASHQCLTGRLSDNPPVGGWPEIGSVVAKLQGGSGGIIPPYVNLSPKMQHSPYNFGHPSFLGVGQTPFMPQGDIKADMTLNNITLDRLDDRKTLLASFDQFRRDADASGTMEGLDAFEQDAFGILTSSRLLEALDVSKEDPRVRERYGKGTEKVQGDAAPRLNEQFLLARRLVEAGARVVTVSYSFWDWHGDNFKRAKENLPDFDQGISALIEDLHQRGMDKDVTVIAWGEFGRTPRINNKGGRDHWPNVAGALMAGGGMQTGQAIGSTDRQGGEADERPVHFQEVFATLYHNLGIDVGQTTVMDLNQRPRYLIEPGYETIRELI